MVVSVLDFMIVSFARVLRVSEVSLRAIHSICSSHHLPTVSGTVWVRWNLFLTINRSSIPLWTRSRFTIVNLTWISSRSWVLHWLLSILTLASSSLAISVSLRRIWLLVVMALSTLVEFWIWMTYTLSNLVFQLHFSLVLFLLLMFYLSLVLLNSSLVGQ